MFEKEIILEEQLAALGLFQCSVDGKLPANAKRPFSSMIQPY
jgi:hypothetical protein